MPKTARFAGLFLLTSCGPRSAVGRNNCSLCAHICVTIAFCIGVMGTMSRLTHPAMSAPFVAPNPNRFEAATLLSTRPDEGQRIDMKALLCFAAACTATLALSASAAEPALTDRPPRPPRAMGPPPEALVACAGKAPGNKVLIT